MSKTLDNLKISSALISVSDKTNLLELAEFLTSQGIAIISTGGTADFLRTNGIDAQEISSYTNFPEIMDGRVKTLHPMIHASLLARKGIDDQIMDEHDVKPIELLVVNLYPFQSAISQEDCSFDTAIENIDIGGPAMVRAAAKNYQNRCVVVDPADYQEVISELQGNANFLSMKTRFSFAAKAFEHIADYDSSISNYFGKQFPECEVFPRTFSLQFTKVRNLRYGENPHQAAAIYKDSADQEGVFNQLQGKELSFNNVTDVDAAFQCVQQFTDPACVIVKHANPCGVSVNKDSISAYTAAYDTDPISAFGGVIAFNRELDSKTAATIVDNQFTEVIVAPKISTQASEVLSKQDNLRVLCIQNQASNDSTKLDFKRVYAGMLLQSQDTKLIDMHGLSVVTKRKPTKQEDEDLIFAFKVVKFVKSNAIVFAKNLSTVGIGAGQMSRVDSARLAEMKAVESGKNIQGSVMASDAFFPFSDSIELAAKMGISAVVQPGGSVKDQEVINAADENNIAMIFTNMRHFRH